MLILVDEDGEAAKGVGDELAIEGLNHVGLGFSMWRGTAKSAGRFGEAWKLLGVSAGTLVKRVRPCSAIGWPLMKVRMGVEAFQVGHLDEVGGVAGAEKADIELIMCDGIDARSARTFNSRRPRRWRGRRFGQCGPARVHRGACRRCRTCSDRDAGRSAGRGRSKFFAAEPSRMRDLSPIDDFFQCFVEREAFVIGGDAGSEIPAAGVPAKAGSVAVDGLVEPLRRGDFGSSSASPARRRGSSSPPRKVEGPKRPKQVMRTLRR